MTTMMNRRRLMAGVAGIVAAPMVVRAQERVVNLYSSRHYDTDKQLFQTFTERTGIRVAVVEANANALLERLRSEGANSPADVMLTVDAGNIERAKGMDLLQPLASEVLGSLVPAHLRDPDGHWFALSKRARVIMVDKAKVPTDAIRDYEDLADPRWRGQVLSRSSTNIYSQSLTGSVLAARGPEATEAWARGVAANFARAPRGGDTDQIRALAAGEGTIAISNTYYLGNLIRSPRTEDREVAQKVAVVFPNQGNRGTHVNITGGGITRHARHRDNARLFLEYLIGVEAQAVFADGNSEYPVNPNAAWPERMRLLGNFKEDKLNAGVFARNNAEALRIMDRAGWK